MSLDNFVVADCKKREKRCCVCLTSETGKGATLSFESVDNIEGSTLGMLSIVDS